MADGLRFGLAGAWLSPPIDPDLLHLPFLEGNEQCAHACCSRCHHHHHHQHCQQHPQPCKHHGAPADGLLGSSDPLLEPAIQGWEGIQLGHLDNASLVDCASSLAQDRPYAESGSKGEEESTPACRTRQQAASSGPNDNNNTQSQPEPEPRRAHYRIERRYRAGINDKIKALERILPSLQASRDSLDDPSDRRDTDPLDKDNSASSGRSKGAVLTGAIDYISQLRRQVCSLEGEIQQLKSRMQLALDSLAV